MATPEVLRAVRAAAVGELGYVGPAGVTVQGVLPLVGARGPVLALTYAHHDLARRIAAAGQVVLTVTEPRGTGSAFAPWVLHCRAALTEDREGERFCEELLDQELLRWPPARAYADSPLLRREHWWWLPRLLVDLDVQSADPFAPRLDPRDHLLVVDQPGVGLAAAVARVGRAALARPEVPLEVEVQHGTPASGEAVLFGQDLSFPDLEQWGQWSWTGEWDGASLRVRRPPRATGVPSPPGVMQRWRRHRALARACITGLRAVD